MAEGYRWFYLLSSDKNGSVRWMLRSAVRASRAFSREPSLAAQNILKLSALRKRKLRKNFNGRGYTLSHDFTRSPLGTICAMSAPVTP
jgi:hypothetical protein